MPYALSASGRNVSVMGIRETHNALDRAIDKHTKESAKGEDGVFVTGWVLITSVSSPDYDGTQSDGYVTYTSDGLQHHATMGLLNVALQERNAVSMLSTINTFMSQAMQDEDDDSEE